MNRLLDWCRVSCAVSCIAGLLTLVDAQANAGPIVIVNPSFELTDYPDGFVGNNITAFGWDVIQTSSPGVTYSVTDPTDEVFPGTTGDNVQGILPDGGQVLRLDRLSVSQTVGVTQANTTYTLSFWVGTSILEGDGSYLVELLDNGAPFASQFGDGPGYVGFEMRQLVGTTGPTVSGALSIRFSEPDGWTGVAYIDAVTLEATSVPEPTSLALWSGLGMMGLVAARRRVRTHLSHAARENGA